MIAQAPACSRLFSLSRGAWAALTLMLVMSAACTESPEPAVFRIDSPAPIVDGQFGRSVAIDGDLLAIGAPGPYVNGAIDCEGAVYLYRLNRTGATLLHTIHASEVGLGGPTGFGVALSIDDGRLLIGAPGARRRGAPLDDLWRGAVAVFTFDGEFENVRLITVIGDGYDTPTSIENADWFGFDVELDGDIVAVAAVHADAGRGAVRLFRTDDTFSRLTPLMTVGPELGLDENDAFAHSVSIDGRRMAIGADKDDGDDPDPASEYGAVYLFDLSPEFDQATLTSVLRMPAVQLDKKDFFGASVVLDSGRLYVGAPGDDGPTSSRAHRGTGVTYIYRNQGDAPPLASTIGAGRDTPLTLNPFDMSGYYVAADGDRIAIGAPIGNAPNTAGHVHVVFH